MLSVSDLNAFYGEVQVLKEVSITVNEGEIVTLVGANASGKTTLLSCISGLLSSFKGKIEWNGLRIDQMKSDQIVELGLIQCPEGRLLFPKLTVQENLELGAYSKRSRTERKKRLEMVYSLLPRLAERSRQLAGLMSGGEAQMCAIGRALMANPVLLMLDEPSLGLAPMVVSEVMKLMKEINQEGVTILLVEQNVRQSLELSDRAYVLENGKIVMQGRGEELLNSEKVKEAYLGF